MEQHNRRGLRIESHDRRSSNHSIEQDRIGKRKKNKVQRAVRQRRSPILQPFRKRISVVPGIFFYSRRDSRESSPVPLQSSSRFALRLQRRVITEPFVREKERKRIILSGKLARRILNDCSRIVKSPIKPDPKKENRRKG